MSNLPEEFVFSQSSLQDYADCARRFELKYLLKQRWPAPEVDDLLEYERRTAQGQQFHQLVHQHQVGIPPEKLMRQIEDAAVRRWFESYLRGGFKGQPEVTLSVPLGNHWLLAKFDLLAIEPGGRALIVDWKTVQAGPLPTAAQLLKRWQTIVYRFVLARAKSIPPEQIEMRYWYAAHDGATVSLPYDSAQMQADEANLLRVLREIETRPDFPFTPDERRCRFCVYRSLNNRGVEAGPLAEWDEVDEDIDLTGFSLDIDQIGEIEF